MVLVRRAILLAVGLLCVAVPAASAKHRTSGLIWGVTLDNAAGIGSRDLAAQVDALGSLPLRPTARVVMDVGTTVADYASSVPAIHGVADVWGQLGDSSEVKGRSTAAYAAWVTKLVNAYKGDVDVWEIGNEVNGEWVGTRAAELARIRAANAVVEAAGGKTALTLYYNPDCWAKRGNEMFRWLAAAALPRGIDYVTLSYYPEDCNGYWPSAATWQSVFDRLHARFPGATLAFGESGVSDSAPTPEQRVALLRRYAAVTIAGDNYAGGYFWWTWARDAVPKGGVFWLGYAAAMH